MDGSRVNVLQVKTMDEHGVEDLTNKWLKWSAPESKLKDNLVTWSNVAVTRLGGSNKNR